MVSATVMLFPDGGSGIKVETELDLADILPRNIEAMPTFIRGKIVKADDGDRLLLQMAKKITAIFNTTQKIYGVAIDWQTSEFKAIDTTEHGI